MKVAAIDPGREKCGCAILDSSGKIFFRGIIPTEDLPNELETMFKKFSCDKIILGNGTSSRNMFEQIRKIDPRIEIVDEYKTTELARKRYWVENPPTGWKKFLPATMLFPPEPVDDWVAVILAERFLQTQTIKERLI